MSNWDIIVLTAMDDQQKIAFELQINQLLDQKFLPSSSTFRVFADEPAGIRIGSGGATLLALKKLYDEFGETLYKKKVLLLHAGGLSQRQPNGSVLGKIFTLVPTKLNRPYTILESKLQIYDIFLQKMQYGGVFLAASDDLEYLPLSSDDLENETWNLNTVGFTLMAHPSLLEIGTNHGVYVLEENNLVSDQNNDKKPLNFTAKIKKVLQKPTVEEMYSNNAVQIDVETKTEFVYTDSNYYFAPDIIEKLLTYFHEKKSKINAEICAYGDFLRPLGDESSSEYIENDNKTNFLKELTSIRRDLYNLFKNVDARALVFGRSKFYHLGTFKELLNLYCSDEKFLEEFHFQKRCFVDIITDNNPKNNFTSKINGCVICSRLKFDSIVPEKCLIEICDFPKGVELLGNNSILSNCRSAKRHSLVSDVFITTLTITDNNGVESFVTIFCSVYENLKQSYSKFDEIPFLNGLLTETLPYLGLLKSKRDTVFGEEEKPKSLWYAKFFTSFSTMEQSFDDAVQKIQQITNKSTNIGSNVEDNCKFYSIHDCISLKNVSAILKHRKMFFDEIEISLNKSGKENTL